jgi:hypothetical protein
MDCGDEAFKDTIGFGDMFRGCDTATKMIMRLYPKKTIEKYRELKPVTKIPPGELKTIRTQLEKQVELIVKEIGEDKLLWVAPIIFQKVLTETLVTAGYTPLLTEKQASELFDFNYF